MGIILENTIEFTLFLLAKCIKTIVNGYLLFCTWE